MVPPRFQRDSVGQLELMPRAAVQEVFLAAIRAGEPDWLETQKKEKREWRSKGAR